MLEILISSSVLILVLAILRLALRDKISARLQYALWLLVLVRLLVPVSFFHSPVSVAEAAAPVTEQARNTSQTVLYMWDIPGSAPPAPAGVSMQLDEGRVINSGQVLLLRDALLLLWNLGMVVMAVWFIAVNVKLARRLKKSRTPYDTDSVPPVYAAEGLPSPCLFGLFRPSVYLTAQAAEDPERARQVIAHERTHYRHGDMIWAFLRSIALVVWWFDPLVWLAASLSRQDCELACDEGTIKTLGEEARFDYGRTLIGMAKVGARPSDLLCGATTMTSSKRSLKTRVARIANAPKMSVTVAVIVLIIAAVTVGCTFSGASNGTPEAEFDILTAAPTPTPAPESVTFFVYDPLTGDTQATTSYDQQEIEELALLSDTLSQLSVPYTRDQRLTSDTPVYTVRFGSGNGDTAAADFQLWEEGQFLLYWGDGGDTGASGAYYDEDGLYAALLEGILDKYHAESAAAVPAVPSGEAPQAQEPVLAQDADDPVTDVIITYQGVEDPGFSEPVGSVIELEAWWYPATAQPRQLRWESSDERVATVDQDGRVTVVGAGACIVTVWADSVSRSCEVYGFE